MNWMISKGPVKPAFSHKKNKFICKYLVLFSQDSCRILCINVMVFVIVFCAAASKCAAFDG